MKKQSYLLIREGMAFFIEKNDVTIDSTTEKCYAPVVIKIITRKRMKFMNGGF